MPPPPTALQTMATMELWQRVPSAAMVGMSASTACIDVPRLPCPPGSGGAEPGRAKLADGGVYGDRPAQSGGGGRGAPRRGSFCSERTSWDQRSWM